jgi:hypothetical protein
MIAKPGYTVAFVRQPKIKDFEYQGGPVSMRITIEGGDLVQAKVVNVDCQTGWADMDDIYYYDLEDGTRIMADACVVTGYGEDTGWLITALTTLRNEHPITEADKPKLDQLIGAIKYDFANQERLTKLPVAFAVEQP